MPRRLLIVLLVLSAVGERASAGGAPDAEPGRTSRLPRGMPRAALRPEPSLPVPRGWPFPDAFPRTFGTGRLVAGSFQWTDFIYDDHGARGMWRDFPVTNLAPFTGAYDYGNDAEYGNNGADLFRIGVGVDDDATYWRVDWNTLLRRDAPIAAFALDTDASAPTGVSEWPAGAGIRSPGIERFLLLSGAGAWLVDPDTGARTPVGTLGGSLTVDMDARSFVVRLPRSALDPSGTWRVRVASGLATEDGTGFETVGSDRGALPGQPNVYNVGFRTLAEERARWRLNFWMDRAQAEALAAGGDVEAFRAKIAWRDLASRVTTPEPAPRGFSNRWYVSSIELGQGWRHDRHEWRYDIRPNFLGRVQPYAVFVPSSYDGSRAVPLTWVLHSLELMHNQYGALDRRFLQMSCEDRGSICATTLGRGPDGWYLDEAELDLWEVWRSLADAYRLDPDRTVISGYSMGGYATYRLGLTYPHLFAKAVAAAAPPLCGFRAVGFAQARAGSRRCATDGDTGPLVANARWLPYVIVHGAADQLVPITSAVEQANRFARRGYRYRFKLLPGDDHFLAATVDTMAPFARALGEHARKRTPGRFTYRWFPHAARPDLGIEPTGAYWIRDVSSWTSDPGSEARIDAVSLARAERAITAVPGATVVERGDGVPGIATKQRWWRGETPEPRPRIALALVNVRTLTVQLGPAGIAPGEAAAVEVRARSPVAVTLDGIADGMAVSVDRADPVTTGEERRVTVALDAGQHVIRVAPADRAS